jgi:hypothetical protein
VLCGRSTIDWNDLVELQHRLLNCFNINDAIKMERVACSDAVLGLHGLINFRMTGGSDLASFLRRTASLGCEDPRDGMFGTLRLPNWEDLGTVAP